MSPGAESVKRVAQIILLLFFAAEVLAVEPVGDTFTYQGFLEDGGVPVNGDVDLRFELFTESAGGTSLSNYTRFSQQVIDGAFTTEVDTLADTVWTGLAVWLEISVRNPAGSGGYVTLSPRQRITAAPYSQYAVRSAGDMTISTTNGLLGGGSSGDIELSADTSYLQRRVTGTCSEGSAIRAIDFLGAVACEPDDTGSPVWSLNGSSAYYNSGFVAVGATTPVRKFQVHDASQPAIRLSSNSGIANNGALEFSETRDQPDANFSIQYDGVANKLHFKSFDGTVKTRMTLERNSGNLGLGTDSPFRKFQIHDAAAPIIRLSTNGDVANNGALEFSEDPDQPDANFAIAYDGATDRLNFKTFDGTVQTRMTLMRNTGYLGIGETNPGVPLHIGVGSPITLGAGGWVQIGDDPLNLAMSDNLIQARSSGSASGLYLNHFGGNVIVQANSGGRVGVGTGTPDTVLDLEGSGTGSGGWTPTDVVARFKQTDSGKPSAISVDALSGQDSSLYLAENGQAIWGLTAHAELGESFFSLRHHHSDLDNEVMLVESAGGASDPVQYIFRMFGDIIPTIDAGYDLGSSNNRWFRVYGAGGFFETSDRRAKDDIQPIETGLEKVRRLNPVRFRWKDRADEGFQYGLVAQEVLDVLPAVVDVPVDPEELLSMNYSGLIPVLVKAIQEQDQTIREQARQLQRQQAALDEIYSLIKPEARSAP